MLRLTGEHSLGKGEVFNLAPRISHRVSHYLQLITQN